MTWCLDPARAPGVVWYFGPLVWACHLPEPPGACKAWKSHPVCPVKFPRTPAMKGLLSSLVSPAWTGSAVILLKQNSFFPTHTFRFSSSGNLPCSYDEEPESIFLSWLRGRTWVLNIASIFSQLSSLRSVFCSQHFPRCLIWVFIPH